MGRMGLLAALLLFLGLGMLQLELPGPNYDEALDAVPALTLVTGIPFDGVAAVTLAGREWPLMVMPYVGPTTTYMVAPLFALGGPSLMLLRLANLTLGAITLVVCWGFLRDFFDARVATVATLLLALDPTYLFWSRIGNYVSLPMLPLALGALWALWRWFRDDRERYLPLAALALGLGLTTKILFLWFWIALGVAWLLLSPSIGRGVGWRRWLWPLERASPPTLLASAGALLVGLAPLLLYNARGLGTLEVLRSNARETELYGVSNLDPLANLGTRVLIDFPTLLDGGWFGRVLGGPHRNPLALPAFLISLALVAWLWRRRRLPFSATRIALLLILLVVILVQSAVTISGFGAHHLMILWPIPQVVVALALVALADHLAPRAAGWRLGVVGLALLLAGAEVVTVARYHRTLAETGGVSFFSDAIYRLERDLRAAGVDAPVALDWGFRRNLQLLSGGDIDPEEGFVYSSSPGEAFAEYINVRIHDPEALYLFHPPETTAFGGHWRLFEEAAYRQGRVPRLWKRYRQRDGEPVILAYRTEPREPSYTPPAPVQRLGYRFGRSIELLGYDERHPSPAPGERLELDLYWRADRALERDYKIFAHLIDATGRLVAQVDYVPMLWGYPTSRWQPGEIITDRLQLPLPADLAPGSYRLLLGLYDAESALRLPVAAGEPPGDAVTLVELKIE